MGTAATGFEHIVLDEGGVPIISGTTMKVVELVVEKISYGWSPEELSFQHPDLTLGQIYSALAYYADHQDELNADIERRLKLVDTIQEAIGTSSLISRLRTQKK
jgi:uncharacterized protein (DUF433 family)